MKGESLDAVTLWCRCEGIPEPVLEYRFAPPRRWRFDWAWPSLKLAVEQEGGAWTQGRHNRAAGFLKDMEKYNAAAAAGWTVLRFTPQEIRGGEAFATIARAMQRAATQENPAPG